MVGTSKVCNFTLSTHRHTHRAEALMHLHFHFLSLVSPKSFAVRNLNGINFWFGRFGIRSMFTLARSMCVNNGRHNGIKVLKRKWTISLFFCSLRTASTNVSRVHALVPKSTTSLPHFLLRLSLPREKTFGGSHESDRVRKEKAWNIQRREWGNARNENDANGFFPFPKSLLQPSAHQ